MKSSPRPLRRRRLRLGLLAISAASALVLAACSSSSPTAGDTSPATKAPLAPLTVILPVASAAFGPVYTAQALGYFKDEGLDLKILSGSGSNALANLVSGQGDLIYSAATLSLVATQAGKPLKLIYAGGSQAQSGVVVVPADSPVKSFKDLDNATIATLSAGSANYGWANIYAKQYGVHINIYAAQDASTMIGSLLAGRAKAAVGVYSWFIPDIANGKLRVLVDTTDASQRAKALGAVANIPEGGAIGEPSVLAKKHDSVVAFLKALDKGRLYFSTKTQSDPEAVAKLLATFSDFQGQPLDQLTTGVKLAGPYAVVPDHGYISQELWNDMAMPAFGQFGLANVNVDDPKFSWKNMIDMSYMKDAGLH